MNQLYWKENSTTKGNPNLKPEDGINTELTFDYSNNIIPFSLCFFTNFYFNKIQWQYNNSVWSPQNIASAFYAGINLNIEKKLFNSLTLKLNYEYLYNSLLEKGDTVICGLSGGADSVCLLVVLNKLKDELGIDLKAAHLNHGIRGEEADRDEAFSKSLFVSTLYTF